MLRALFAAAFLLAAAGCDSGGPDDGPGGPPGGTPSAQPEPVVADAPFPEGRGDAIYGLRFEAATIAGRVASGPQFTGHSAFNALALYTVNLWLSGTQDGQERYSALGSGVRSGSAACSPVFRLASGVDYAVGEWPVDQGAPLDVNEQPRVYGDLMTWRSVCSAGLADADRDRPLQSVRTNVALFEHERADLDGVRFLRFEVTNTGTAPITDFRAALSSDPDVGDSGRHRANLLGGTDCYATVYISPEVTGPEVSSGSVGALGFLQLPDGVSQAGRRVVYRDSGPGATSSSPSRVPFTQYALFNDEGAALRAMRALDDNGDPVIDPTTGAPDPFMFGGDPVAGAGWLDGTFPDGERGWDIRLLQPTTPTTLGPGETLVFTAVVIGTVQADLASGLAAVDAAFAAVAAEPALWTFPTADAPSARR